MLSEAYSQTIDRVRAALARPGVTAREMARRARLHRNTFVGYKDDSWKPTVETLLKIEPHLQEVERHGKFLPDDATVPAGEPERAAA